MKYRQSSHFSAFGPTLVAVFVAAMFLVPQDVMAVPIIEVQEQEFYAPSGLLQADKSVRSQGRSVRVTRSFRGAEPPDGYELVAVDYTFLSSLHQEIEVYAMDARLGASFSTTGRVSTELSLSFLTLPGSWWPFPRNPSSIRAECTGTYWIGSPPFCRSTEEQAVDVDLNYWRSFPVDEALFCRPFDRCVIAAFDMSHLVALLNAEFDDERNWVRGSADWRGTMTLRYHYDPVEPVVPEPGTLVLLGSGLLGLTRLRRRN